ncbi:lipase family protein [Mycobacterium sp. 21AC1]|uniref:lipase family protein n=1 Tax=[Mycobacterium] appelbergii TaxID=2939269 RepID=UPI002939503E|nr:lipase family protein [Mycobacterium sp. 21AC1]MDV3123714.1 lipase family protein [Mycobacterium sp. 21AC1]
MTPRPVLPGEDPFYEPPPGFESQPAGAILRARQVELALFGIVRQAVSAWQLLYRSCDLNRQPQVAVTTVLLPSGADPGQHRPLLAYQCAIDAVADAGFPSYALRHGARSRGCVPQFEFLVIANALDRGWAVSIADHEGRGGFFGAPREPGYRVLDGIRAAMSFEPLGLAPEVPVAVWGYSGGGMASSWVIEMAPEYAPEIAIVGAVLGAPVGDPGQTLLKLNGTWLAGLPTMVIAALRHLYPDLNRLLRTHVNPEGLHRLDAIEKLGTVAAIRHFRNDDLDNYTDQPLADLLATPEIVLLIDDLRLGLHRPACPVMVLQPVHDQFIDVRAVDGQVQRYLDAGAHVEYLRDRLSEHLTLMPLSAPAALDWLTDRIAGRPLGQPGITTVLSLACSRQGIGGLLRMAQVAGRVFLGLPLRARDPQQAPAAERDGLPAA